MLTIKNLSVDYGSTRVVHNLDFALSENEILMLVGPTGCGKTTILQAVAGLVPMAEGEVQLGHWQATPVTQVPPEKRNVGMVFQDFALFPHMTVEQNVTFKLSNDELASYWLELLGLNDFRKVKPGTLSGGQKQRVALARTLAHEPSLVLLDEPLSNLDAALKDSLRWEIRNALKAAGVPAIWVTHDQEEALSIGDRLGILQNGVLEQLASPEECYGKPANRFVARFLGEASFISCTVDNKTATTSLGAIPCFSEKETGSVLDLLLRPDDLSISPVQAISKDNNDVGKNDSNEKGIEQVGNGTVNWSRYEGGSWLYSVSLDEGSEIQIRASHETLCEVESRVAVVVTTSHPMATFERS